MFRSATIRLTLWYLVIIMIVSLLFSVVLYWALRNELNINVRRQVSLLQEGPRPPQFENQPNINFEEARRRQFEESSQRIRLRLIQFNVLILLLGAGTSYLLARRTLRPIQESLNAQSRFTADASHELRTPLTAMRSEIEVALREQRLRPKDVGTLLSSNLEEIAKLEALSTSLLRLADYENGTKKDHWKTVSLRKLLDAALARVQSIATARQVTIERSGERGLTVYGDTTRLTELFVTLLDNAIKYSSEGTTIRVRSTRSGQAVQIAVVDRGIGIKASDIPHLFDRFYRADASRSNRNVSGYGLGLAIAKQTIDSHKGKILVESTPGKGSTFTVTLPLAKPKKA